jgi:hypothetical protein
MELFLGVLSAILGTINVIQWILKLLAGSDQRARAQNEYLCWQQLAEMGETLEAQPEHAAEIAHSMKALALQRRNEIVAYSRERLNFVPWYEHPANPRPLPERNKLEKVWDILRGLPR